MGRKRPECPLWCLDDHASDDSYDTRENEALRPYYAIWEEHGIVPPGPFRKPPGDPVCPRRDYKLTPWQWFQIRVLRLTLKH